MSYDREYSFLKIEFANSIENRKGTFKLNLEEIAVESIEVPEINFQVRSQIPSLDFQNIIRNLYSITSEV